MANFNYTDLKFFNKSGIEIPMTLQGAYKIIIPSEYGEPAIFYAVTDSSYAIVGYHKVSSGSRFTKTDTKPAIVEFHGNAVKVTANVVINELYENNAFIEELKGLSVVPFEQELVDNFVYPSITMVANLSIDPVSTELIETETIYVLAQNNDGEYAALKNISDSQVSNWANRYDLMFFCDNRKQSDFRCFDIDKISNEIIWSDRCIMDFYADEDLSYRTNIGFCAKEEGYYEQTLHIFLLDKEENNGYEEGEIYLIGKILLSGEAIGEDERYRTLFTNFGIPDPIKTPHIFSNTDVQEDKIDNMLLNENSKKLFLTYNEIFPYVGTYKALANAIKLLGYTDIFFKEWYKSLNDSGLNRYITYDLNYDNLQDSTSINKRAIEERLILKKLNWLSLVYKINDIVNDMPVDEYGFPQVIKKYSATNPDVLIKLIALKEWIEKYIIGLNCRIVDIEGEGVYFERYMLAPYGGIQQNIEYTNTVNLAPIICEDNDVFLIDNQATITVDVNPKSNATIEDYKESTFSDFCNGYIDKSNVYHIGLDGSEDATIRVGGTYEYPENLDPNNTFSIRSQVKLNSFVIGKTYLDENSCPLRIFENEIDFIPTELLSKEESAKFTVLPEIRLERANFYSADTYWKNELLYSISGSKNGFVLKDIMANQDIMTSKDVISMIAPSYIINDSTVTITPAMGGDDIIIERFVTPEIISDFPESNGPEQVFSTDNTTYGLVYKKSNNMTAPMFTITGYSIFDEDSSLNPSKSYVLEILDGKMVFNETNRTVYLNFNYDSNNGEQTIEVNIVYNDSEEFHICEYFNKLANDKDATEFANKYLSEPEQCVVINTLRDIEIHNAGNIDITVFMKNLQNNIYAAQAKGQSEVMTQKPDICAFVNDDTLSNTVHASDEEISMLKNKYVDFCILEKEYISTGLDISADNGTITHSPQGYSIENANAGETAHLVNLSDMFKVTAIDKTWYCIPEAKEFASYMLVLNRITDSHALSFFETALDSDGHITNVTPYKILSSVANKKEVKEEDIPDYYDYYDVNVVFYNTLAGIPMYQVPGYLCKSKSINADYPDGEYRLYLPDATNKSYVYASLDSSVINTYFKLSTANYDNKVLLADAYKNFFDFTENGLTANQFKQINEIKNLNSSGINNKYQGNTYIMFDLLSSIIKNNESKYNDEIRKNMLAWLLADNSANINRLIFGSDGILSKTVDGVVIKDIMTEYQTIETDTYLLNYVIDAILKIAHNTNVPEVFNSNDIESLINEISCSFGANGFTLSMDFIDYDLSTSPESITNTAFNVVERVAQITSLSSSEEIYQKLGDVAVEVFTYYNDYKQKLNASNINADIYVIAPFFSAAMFLSYIGIACALWERMHINIMNVDPAFKDKNKYINYVIFDIILTDTNSNIYKDTYKIYQEIYEHFYNDIFVNQKSIYNIILKDHMDDNSMANQVKKELYNYWKNEIINSKRIYYIPTDSQTGEQLSSICDSNAKLFCYAISDGTYYIKNADYPDDGIYNISSDNYYDDMLPSIDNILNKSYIDMYIQPTWQSKVRLYIDANAGKEENRLYITYDDSASFAPSFYPGDIVKLTFTDIHNNNLVGQSSYKVISYDKTSKCLVLVGTLPESLIVDSASYVYSYVRRADEMYINKVSSTEGTITQTFFNDGKYTTIPVPCRVNTEVGNAWEYSVMAYDPASGMYYRLKSNQVRGIADQVCNIYISYAHTTFVDYDMKIKDATETIDGKTKITIEPSNSNLRTLHFVDTTFGIIVSPVDKLKAQGMWMDYIRIDKDHIIPTICENDIHKTGTHATVYANNANAVFVADYSKISDIPMHVYWRVKDHFSDFEFISYNEVLYLNSNTPGLYDIECIAYDDEGNMYSNFYEGAYKINKV